MAEEVTLGKHVESSGVVVSGREVLSAGAALHAARHYLSLGWAVTAGPGLDSVGACACETWDISGRIIPEARRKVCRNPGKHAYAGWGEPERKVMTLESVEKYWAEDNVKWANQPVDQVFLVPYLSGLIVADVDKMENWEALDKSVRPDTLWVRSGSGRGGHFFYNYEWDLSGPAPSLAGKLPGGAGELKFRGIIAAPPSVHKSGGRYTWAPGFDVALSSIADVPDYLLEKSKRSFGTPYSNGDEWSSLKTSIENDGGLNFWNSHLFAADKGSMLSIANVKQARPLAMFAAAASMAKWIEVGVITSDEVVRLLLDCSAENGALTDYGEHELTRQILNGIEAGKTGLKE